MDIFQQKIEDHQRYAAYQGHGEPHRPDGETQQGDEGHTQPGISGILPAAPGDEMDRVMHAVPVYAIFQDGEGIIACGGLVLVKAPGRLPDAGHPDQDPQQEDGQKEQQLAPRQVVAPRVSFQSSFQSVHLGFFQSFPLSYHNLWKNARGKRETPPEEASLA